MTSKVVLLVAGVALVAFVFWPRKAVAANLTAGAMPGATPIPPAAPPTTAAGIAGSVLDSWVGGPTANAAADLIGGVIDPDAPSSTETGEQWIKRMGAKYNGKTFAQVPAHTLSNFRNYALALHDAVALHKAPSYNQNGPHIIRALISNRPNAGGTTLGSPGATPAYWGGAGGNGYEEVMQDPGQRTARRNAIDASYDLARMGSVGYDPSSTVALQEIRLQKNWGILGTGITTQDLSNVGKVAITVAPIALAVL